MYSPQVLQRISGEGCHETDGLLSISLAAFLASELGRGKVGCVEFAKDFEFRHG